MILSSRHLIGAAAVLCAAVSVSSAQGVKIEFANGLVSVNAQQVPLRVVLSEWARLGGTTIVGADRVTGAALTLELTGVTERQALEVILREVPGFMLAAREDPTKGASRFDRIMLLPQTSAPRNAPAATFSSAPPPFGNDANRANNPPEQDAFVNRAQEEAERRAEELAQRVREASEAMGRLLNQPGNQNNQNNQNAPQNRNVVTPSVTVRPGAPATFDDPPNTPAATPPPPAPGPANPFMPTPGAATPGTITPAPQQQPQRK